MELPTAALHGGRWQRCLRTWSQFQSGLMAVEVISLLELLSLLTSREQQAGMRPLALSSLL